MVRNLAVFATLLLASCSKPVAPEYRAIRNFSLQALNLDTSVLKMDIVYFNPNSFGLTLNKVDCDIYVNKIYLGKYVLDTSMVIDKRSEFALPSTVKVGMRTIYRNGLNFLTNSELLIEAKGSTQIRKAGFNFNIPVNYSGRHKFSMF